MKKINSLLILMLMSIGLYAQDSLDCPVMANFTYEIDGGNLNLTNTTTGATMPLYSWSVDGLSSWEENPTFPTADFEESENVCLTVYDSLEDCSDTYCMLIYFLEDSLADSTGCEIEASFTYTISGGMLHLTNTTIGADMPLYNWSVDGLSSWEENPSFPTTDFEDSEDVCLTVYDSLEDCSDTYCMLIYFADDSLDDSTDCVIDASFTYVIEGDELVLTNTTTGEESPLYYWSVDGLSSSEEHPTFSTVDFEDEEEICLTVYDSLADCSDTYCLTIYLADDSTWTDSTAGIMTFNQTNLTIFPNPVQNVLHLSFDQLDRQTTIYFFNQVGQLVMTEQISEGTVLHEINVSDLNTGMYVIYIQSDQENALPQQYKFIKK